MAFLPLPDMEILLPLTSGLAVGRDGACLLYTSEEIESCIAAPNTVEAEIETRELARIIESFLDTLTTENRVIFMRRY